MIVDGAVFHRYAVDIPDRLQLEEQKNWLQIAQVVIVITTAALASFAMIYSSVVIESAIVGTASVIVILAAASHLWDYCEEWTRKLRKAIEIAILFERIDPMQVTTPEARILTARIHYFEKSYLYYRNNADSIRAAKEQYKQSNDLATPAASKAIFDFRSQIYEMEKQVAIARIKIAWLNILIKYPQFQGDLSDLCYYSEQEKFEEHCIFKDLVADLPHATSFLFFQHDQSSLTLQEVLNIDMSDLQSKLYPSVEAEE
jgi:hypothetical protein